ncbi:MAG TPA: 2-phospho-L-lactate transferase CofD family protein [Solirubrobacteraceae bacterium]|nr:2-phospho-L-lactate transferase CofD family protein [Solirubrobacteraceae bacterium]
MLAGGTGGARLARGLLDVVGPESLTVIANTGDDIEIYGAYVSPDPDLITFWLADQVDSRGWGLEGDTFEVMNGLRGLGEDVWFNLGDRDLAMGQQRAAALAAGARLTEAHAALVSNLGLEGQRGLVLPMSDEPVRTRVLADGTWHSLQEFLIVARGQGLIEDVQFTGADVARATAEVLAAIEQASVILIGPSNPILSIGPILAVREIRQALLSAGAPVVAVSPLVGGKVLKGPTAACMRWAGVPVSAAGVARIYDGLIHGLVCDEPVAEIETLQTDMLLAEPDQRRRLAQEALAFAANLTTGRCSSSFPRA